MPNLFKIYIYTLSDCREPDNIRYVGITRDIKNRHKSHRHSHKYLKSKKAKWIKEVFESGGDIEMNIIHTSDSEKDSKDKEMFYIKHFKDAGFDLVNSTIGGQGNWGFKHTQESRAKMSANLIGSARHKMPHTEETKEKFRQRMLGTKMSEETKAKMSLAHKGKPKSARHKENVRLSWIIRKQKKACQL
jgi:group I intron endonuclease